MIFVSSSSVKDSPNANKVLGYNTAWAESVVAMAFAHGRKSQVVNIGIDMMQLVLPRGVTAHKYTEAFAHKVLFISRFHGAFIDVTTSADTTRRDAAGQ